MFAQTIQSVENVSRALSRSAFICLLMCAVVYPKISAVIMEVVPSIQTMVICTGDRLIIMRFDSNGVPIDEPETTVEHCLVADDVVAIPVVTPLWKSLARSYQHAFVVKLNVHAGMDRLLTKLPSRAPPVLI